MTTNKKCYSTLITTVVVFCCLFYSFSFAQYSVDWTKYLNDSVPDADFSNDDESEQLVVDVKNILTHDEYVYVIGRSFAKDNTEGICGLKALNYGTQDAFLAKYDKCGNLQWMKFIGTDKDGEERVCGDIAYCLALDKDTEANMTYIYVGGYSYSYYTYSCDSCSFCKPNNSKRAFACDFDSCIFQEKRNSEQDGFIAKFTENGELEKWTYFGGSADVDYILGMDIFEHNVFITGVTYSDSSFIPIGTPTFDKTLSEGIIPADAYVAEFDGDLCSLKFFSYIGGEGAERGRDIKVFRDEITGAVELYLSGTCNSEMNNFSYHPLNSYKGGPGDAFISLWKLNENLTLFEPQWLEYVGGQQDDHGREIIVDDRSNVILTGFTNSNDFIESTSWSYPNSNFYDQSYNGGKDVYVAKFNAKGMPLWGTYFGGSGEDLVRGLVRYSLTPEPSINYIVLAGATKSTNLPSQPLHPAFQNELNGSGQSTKRDAFIAILTDPCCRDTTQRLEFSSFIGGTRKEWADAFLHVGPDVALGANKEIYFTVYTQSNDIESYIESADYYHNSKSGNDTDGLLAKILNANIFGQFNCIDFDWGDANRVGAEGFYTLNNSMNIYPNPAADKIALQLNASNISYKLFNIHGEELLFGTWLEMASQKTIDISSLPVGIYILKCIMEDKSQVQEFIISR